MGERRKAGRVLLRYESHAHPPVRGWPFARRVALHALLAGTFVALSLLGGMTGYHVLEGLGWRRSYLNAAMILGGMGPVDPVKSPEGEWFAGTFALYGGLMFVVVAGLMIAPVAHRLLHELKWEERS
jgi:hypothetical protein